MTTRVGIRREDEGRFERRTTLIPYHARLLRLEGTDVTVQSSPMRAYTDAEYQAGSAAVHEYLGECHIVFGVQPPRPEDIEPGVTHACYARVAAAGSHLGPLLRQLLAQEATLVDIDALRDGAGRPLVSFARHAGYAGFIDGLWALGKKLKLDGHVTPLLQLRPASEYEGIDQIRLALMQVARRMVETGLPLSMGPLVIGFVGRSGAAAAAEELCDLLPVREIPADELERFAPDPQLSAQRIYKTVFELRHCVERTDAVPFDELRLATQPASHRACLAPHLRHVDLLVHGIDWPEGWPALLPRELLVQSWSGPKRPRLQTIVDLTRESGGGLAPYLPATTTDRPAYIYRPGDEVSDEGFTGRGPLVIAPEAPSNELARDASAEFGQRLLPFASGLTWGVVGRRLDIDRLPPIVRAAVVTYRGELLPAFASLSRWL